jgi:two-component system, cell cycle sensor histidine kinase and response regulator CckA
MNRKKIAIKKSSANKLSFQNPHRRVLAEKPHYKKLHNHIGILEREVRALKKAREQLKKSRERYRVLFRHYPLETILVDRDGRVTAFNNKRKTLKKMRVHDRLPAIGDRIYTADYAGTHKIDMRNRLMTCIQTGRSAEFARLKYNDRFLTVNISPFPEGAIITTIDVTDQVRSEKFSAQHLQSQKMESVGTLAGGIAHDFNNILWIIAGNTELAESEIPQGNPALLYLSRVNDACMRAKELIAQILSFSRQTDQERKPLKLSTIVKESLKLIRSSLPSTIEIRNNFSFETDTINANLSQINQVLFNLCANASHAMRKTGGILEISLSNVVFDKIEAQRHEHLKPGKYILLSVQDSGVGIPDVVLGRIFDPFFTTKNLNEGTGLGLSVVYGIIKDHDGIITVNSKPQKGSTFHMFLPALEENTKELITDSLEPLPMGNERVLFVDDEDAVLKMGEKMLLHLGYEVTTTRDPAEAINTFRADPEKIDLVITDQTMPGITGENLAKIILQIKPTIPIIICTGFSELISEKEALSMGIKAFLMKPIVMGNFAVTIRKVLDQQIHS